MATMTEQPMLGVRDVVKRFGGLTAVNGVRFDVPRGQAVALIGPNGAGKTTLFNIVAGFERPNEGAVHFNGQAVTAKPPHVLVRRGLARSFQIPHPFSDLSVLQNVLVGCWAGRASGGKNQQRAYALGILDRVELGHRAAVPAAVLSVGEAKRLELARVLATDPEMVLLDEPFGGLTAGEIAPLAEILQSLRSEGRTILVVEHRLREVLRLVERVVVMDRGSLIADGAPSDVVSRPIVLEAYFGDKGVRDLGLA